MHQFKLYKNIARNKGGERLARGAEKEAKWRGRHLARARYLLNLNLHLLQSYI